MNVEQEKLYEKYEALSPIYQGGLTNHLPMMFTALVESGVSTAKIEEILDKYKSDKDLYELTDVTYPTSDFEQAYINQTGYYLGRIHEVGVDITVGVFMNDMTHALSSGLYHGLIRLAYGLKSKHDVLIAQALAYFECLKSEEEEQGQVVSFNEFEMVCTNLDKIRSLMDAEFSAPGTYNKIEVIKQRKELMDKIVVVKDIQFHQKELLELFARRYKHTQDFYTLHILTGFDALLEIEEFIPQFSVVLNRFLYSAQIIMLLENGLNPIDKEHTRGFDEILSEIDQLHDEHEIKLVYSLSTLYRRFNVVECLEIANHIMDKKGE